MNLRKSWVMAASMAAVLALSATGPAWAEEGDGKGHGEPSMEEQMAAWMQYADPGEEHEFLKKMVGTWKATARMEMPGMPPTESEGTSTNKMILGGRFLQTEFSGQMMNMPFKGLALDGFDRFKQKYVGLWMDTMGTMMMTFEGSVDGGVRTMVAEFKDPLSGEMKKMKGVTRIVSDDEHVYEGWEMGPDGEFRKSMQVTYVRQ